MVNGPMLHLELCFGQALGFRFFLGQTRRGTSPIPPPPRVVAPIGPLRFDYAWGDGGTYNGPSNGYPSGQDRDSGSGIVHFNIENMF